MLKKVYILFIFALISCVETENPLTDFGQDYQPLAVGKFWVYQVSETIVFGEGDAEERDFFIRDVVQYSYRNAEDEVVFVLKRETSTDLNSWLGEGNYSLLIRRNTLVRQFENQITVPLVFPPELGRTWDAMAYNASVTDMYEVDFRGNVTLGEQTFQRSVRVLQEMEDDEITFRDKRYEVYSRGVGMIEQYSEVFTYCSRNDCLGEMILNSGRQTHLKIIEYGG
jgi:hypothetical protein